MQMMKKDVALSLPELIGKSACTSKLASELRLPNISGSAKSIDTNRQISIKPLELSSKSGKKHLRVDRWKMNKQYIDGYNSPQSKRMKTQIYKKIDLTVIKRKPYAFFTAISNSSEDEHDMQIRNSKEQIEQAIQKSNDFIKLIKKNRSKLIKLRVYNQNKAKFQNTEDKNNKNKQIYNYLSRKFVVKKDQEISDQVINRYISTSSSDKLRKLEEKGRQFLLKKIKNDYRNHLLVDNYKRQQARSMILKQIDTKKMDFSQDYKSRLHTPYFSFLTLSKQEKDRVLYRRQRKSLI